MSAAGNSSIKQLNTFFVLALAALTIMFAAINAPNALASGGDGKDKCDNSKQYNAEHRGEMCKEHGNDMDDDAEKPEHATAPAADTNVTVIVNVQAPATAPAPLTGSSTKPLKPCNQKYKHLISVPGLPHPVGMRKRPFRCESPAIQRAHERYKRHLRAEHLRYLRMKHELERLRRLQRS